MRVLMTDHLVRKAGKKAGIGHYAHELVAALRRLNGPDAVHSWHLTNRLFRRQQWMDWQCRRYETVARRPGTLAWVETKLRGRFLNWVRAAFPVMRNPIPETLRRTGCDLYHEPNFIPQPLDLPTVVSVHDLSAVRFPQWHPPERVKHFERAFHQGLEFAAHLIAISEFGKSEIVNHLGWPADRVTVTYMGVRPELGPVAGDDLRRGLKALGLEPGYLLHVGTLEPRKNLDMLVRAYCALPAGVRERHPLVLAGGPGWKSEGLRDFLRGPGRDQNVRWLGYVRGDLFPALYSGARALAFPTWYEGFGMPTVEMLACGGAVLASTAGAVAETVGGAAHLTDPGDEPGWRDALLRACADPDWVAELRRGGREHAARYTWERCAEQSMDAYRKTLERPDRYLKTAGAKLTPAPAARAA